MSNKKRFFASLVALGVFCVIAIIGYKRFYMKPITLEELERRYAHLNPSQWGENLPGVTTLLPSQSLPSIVYLTFDACGGSYDRAIIDYLIEHNIPATLFINARWIEKHTDDFLSLAHNPLFSIQNHGARHLPLSANGRSIYHIKGTESIAQIYDEVMENHKLIVSLTGKIPRYFRSGTAYYDEIAVSVLKDLGYEIGGFDVLGDAGATFSKSTMLKQIDKVRNGSILIYHFNKPKSSTYAGIIEIIPLLTQRGFVFGKLE
ncbi:MAG: polysaccharide deacetylase family protein [Helicobacter sp.]|uniref:polysaccharide deacetylase family protein n=1 Tax=Helicobacter sp. TaxID=218 RepID=UPI0025BE9BBB|nr:polysaccharide deacetylase family protein [Helicobacter sp.]MCH5313976.1 polysaccharide deacetylase family protein [Helicobacter sp.]